MQRKTMYRSPSDMLPRYYTRDTWIYYRSVHGGDNMARGNSVKSKPEAVLWSATTESKESLDARIAACQAKGDRVIIYHSGKENLTSLTADLLRQNRYAQR